MAQSPTALQRIKELDGERSQLVATAKEEALAEARAAIVQLKELGFSYSLADARGGASRGSKPESPKGVGQVKEAPCPVCEFQTLPPHDARRHRAQGDRKRPFTSKQLEEFGLTRVG